MSKALNDFIQSVLDEASGHRFAEPHPSRRKPRSVWAACTSFDKCQGWHQGSQFEMCVEVRSINVGILEGRSR
jgi:hypothetical protein